VHERNKVERRHGTNAVGRSHPPENIQTFLLRFVVLFVSLLIVKQSQLTRKLDRLAARLPGATDILRGSLLERVIRHRSGCLKCARGEGHPVAVLAVGYPGGRTRQISLRREQVRYVKRCLANYQKLRATIEEICELNRQLLRAEPDDENKRDRTR
jgi:hypothetical protein